jgi:hypothetical protein
MATPLENALDFLESFGFFDVILPFLLVFTIVFAILEKSAIFGKEKIGDTMASRSSINSMVAFVIALFVVVTKEIVQSLREALPQVALILVIVVSFMMLAGSLSKGDEPFNFDDNNKNWKIFLTLTLFTSVLAVFLNSIGWLFPILDYVTANWDETFIVSLIFLAIVIGIILYIVRTPKEESTS